MKYQVQSNQSITSTIRQVTLSAVEQPLQFKAGQYIEFVVSEKELAPFSIANAPNSQGDLQFFIREDKSDPLLQSLLPQLELESKISVLGPFGECVYQQTPLSNVILLVGGVGIGQVKSIIEDAIKNNDQRAFHLYWGVGCESDAFLIETFKVWQQRLNFNYTICLRKKACPIELILNEFNDLSACEVYSSGPWQMTDDAWQAFARQGLPKAQMHSDRFAFV